MSLSKNIVAQKSYGLSCVLSNMVIWGYTRIPWYMGLSENGETTTSHGTLNTVINKTNAFGGSIFYPINLYYEYSL